ncbi:hypothetical protein EKH55_1512 [Sinorhizobium alkalisoli]|nr:hypothetical protein EKH55_1512 [Sinorhizobium alkalisoli]
MDALAPRPRAPAAIRLLHLLAVVGYEDPIYEAMMSGRGENLGIAVRLLAAFALLLLAFAHKPGVAQHASPALSAEYRLPDGAFADICFGTHGVDGGPQRGKAPAVAPVCEACRLAASILLPLPPKQSGPAVNGSWMASRPAVADQVTSVARRLLPPSRAPPAFS